MSLDITGRWLEEVLPELQAISKHFNGNALFTLHTYDTTDYGPQADDNDKRLGCIDSWELDVKTVELSVRAFNGSAECATLSLALRNVVRVPRGPLYFMQFDGDYDTYLNRQGMSFFGLDVYYDTDKAWHGYSFEQLYSYASWRKRVNLAKGCRYIDVKWCEHSLQREYSALRVSNRGGSAPPQDKNLSNFANNYPRPF